MNSPIEKIELTFIKKFFINNSMKNKLSICLKWWCVLCLGMLMGMGLIDWIDYISH